MGAGGGAGRRATVRCPLCLTLNRVDLTRAATGAKCGRCGRPIRLDRPIRITDGDFARAVGEAEVPVLVDFYADWCGPCKIMAPVLDELARERAGSLLVGKLDTDANPATTRRYEIRSIPTLVLFRDGAEVAREIGAVPRGRIEALIGRAA